MLYNGGTEGVANTVINTEQNSTTNDGINKLSGKSTRTGYYLRKLLRQDVNLDPNKTTKQFHYTPRIRYTELFLNYAEAANEAWGPTGKGSHNYSAYDVIKALHNRAGVGNDYLESIKTNKEKMRELIRNERRIELSFEGFRFWDIRRWNLVDAMTAEVKGMSIVSSKDGDNTTYTYTVVPVEKRSYKDYMIYGPIPYSEMVKFDQLSQNKGWETK